MTKESKPSWKWDKFLTAAVLAVVVWLGVYWVLRLLPEFGMLHNVLKVPKLGHEEHGQIGDAFGPVSALATTLAFIFTWRTFAHEKEKHRVDDERHVEQKKAQAAMEQQSRADLERHHTELLAQQKAAHDLDRADQERRHVQLLLQQKDSAFEQTARQEEIARVQLRTALAQERIALAAEVDRFTVHSELLEKALEDVSVYLKLIKQRKNDRMDIPQPGELVLRLMEIKRMIRPPFFDQAVEDASRAASEQLLKAADRTMQTVKLFADPRGVSMVETFLEGCVVMVHELENKKAYFDDAFRTWYREALTRSREQSPPPNPPS